MDIIEQIGLEDNCTFQELSQKLIEFRKRINFQKNSANSEKRANAELMENASEKLQSICDTYLKFAANDFTNYKLFLETYDSLARLPNSPSFIPSILNNDREVIFFVIKDLIANQEFIPAQKWCKYAIEKLEEPRAYYYLAETCSKLNDFEMADKWYTKAEEMGVITNYSDWAIIKISHFNDFREGIRLLEKGLENGELWCVVNLFLIYIGDFSLSYVDIDKAKYYANIINETNPEVAKICYKQIMEKEAEFAPDSDFMLFLSEFNTQIAASGEFQNKTGSSFNISKPILTFKSGAVLTETQKSNYFNEYGHDSNNKILGTAESSVWQKIVIWAVIILIAFMILRSCV